MARIEIDLDRGDVSVTDFADALSTQVHLVREVMASMQVPTSEVRWVIKQMRAGSAYALAEAQLTGPHAFMDGVERAVRAAGQGVNRLLSSAERPDYFNDEALRLSRRLIEVVHQSNAGEARLRFGPVIVRPGLSITANVSAIMKSESRAIGSIEGQLVAITGTDGQYRVYIRDRVRHRDVPCVIQTGLLALALASYERRVIARGVVHSRADGAPSKIEVRSLEVIAADDQLPTPQDVRGILHGFELADGE